MRPLKSKTEQTLDTVTREEFTALQLEFDAFKQVTALAIAAAGLAIKASPGMPDSNSRTRLEKLAVAADLEPAERAELVAFLKRLDSASRVESRREFREAQESTKPRRPESFRPPSWRG